MSRTSLFSNLHSQVNNHTVHINRQNPTSHDSLLPTTALTQATDNAQSFDDFQNPFQQRYLLTVVQR